MSELLRRLATRHGPFVLACGALLGLFQFLIAAAVASVDVSGALQSLLDSLPPFLRSVIETQLFGGLNTSSLLAFGWNHPIAHALGTAVAVVLGAHAVAGEIESGAMELVMAQPFSRLRYLGAHVGFGTLALAAVSAAGIAGTVVGGHVFALEPHGARTLLQLGIGYASLQWAWFGIALMLSSFGREEARVAGTGVLLALISYVAFVVGSLWERAAFVLPYSPHHHFVPRDILVLGAGIGRPVALMVSIGAVAIAAAALQFRRRDLP